MLKWLIRNRLAAFERTYGYDTSYMRDLLAADTRAFFAFARAAKLSDYRKDVPIDVHYAAKLTAVVAEDCGPCTQLVVTLALRDGVAPKSIAAILERSEEQMTDELRLGVHFTRAVIAHDPAADDLREDILKRWGPRALVSLGFAIVSARMFPTIKYALGHGKTCQRVVVAGESITPASRHAA